MLKARSRSSTNDGSGINMTKTMLTTSAGTTQSALPPAIEFNTLGFVAIYAMPARCRLA
jgi:hypothetical protein